MFSLINIIAFVISIYVIYNIVEMCKQEYIEAYKNINNDKNWFIIIFKQFLFITTAILLSVYMHSLHYNHPVKSRKFAKIVPI